MGKVLALANQKGGVGKSTTAINLSACLAELGKNVLVIDLDPQGNTSSGFGLEKGRQEHTIYDVISGEASLAEALVSLDQMREEMSTSTFLGLKRKKKAKIGNIDIVPANVDLAGAEVELISSEESQGILKEALAEYRDQYDYVMIDCPPSLSILTINALTAADGVLVPIQCEYYALEGLAQLLQTIDLVKDSLNPELQLQGIIFTMYDSRNRLSTEVVENVKENLPGKSYYTMIPRNVRLAEAPSYGQPIILYDPRSTGADAYRRLAKEVVK